MTKDLLCSIVLTTILNVVDINERIGIVASLDMIKEINSALVENILERVAITKAEPILLQDTLQMTKSGEIAICVLLTLIALCQFLTMVSLVDIASYLIK